MARPKLSDVTDWRDVTIDVHQHAVKVESGTLSYKGYSYPGGAYSVRNLSTGKRTLFYGESAWSDAERLVQDIVWAANR